MTGMLYTALDGYAEAARLFERAGAARLACIMQLNFGCWWAFIGEPDRGAPELASGLAIAERVGASFLRAYGLIEVALSRAQKPDVEATVAAVEEALPLLVNHTRLPALGAAAAAFVLVDAGQHARADRFVEIVAGLPMRARMHATQLGLQARSLVHRGEVSRAIDLAREAVRIDDETSEYELFAGLPHLALSEACGAAGDREGAAAAIRAALDRVLEISPEVTTDPARLRAYLSRATPNATIVTRARELGVTAPAP
jgi:hypothetical protein